MSVVAIGTDMVSVTRIANAYQRRGQAFAKRILTADEQQELRQSGNPVAYLAKRFAAKEAVAKALGTGIGRGLSWQQISTYKDSYGAPHIELTGFALERLQQLGATRCLLSLSDERDYALAFVVLS